MRREEIRDLFIRKGFNLREVSSQDYTLVERNGETVGCIYEDSVYVGAAVYHLQGSEERFVDMTRAKRVNNIRRYFEKKKERYLMTMMGRLSDALNEVGNAFNELKED